MQFFPPAFLFLSLLLFFIPCPSFFFSLLVLLFAFTSFFLAVNPVPDPPYRLSGNSFLSIKKLTISFIAIPYWGPQYNTHNLYGALEARATFHVFENLRNQRPFVLDRSTFVGSGEWAAHWTGMIRFVMLRAAEGSMMWSFFLVFLLFS